MVKRCAAQYVLWFVFLFVLNLLNSTAPTGVANVHAGMCQLGKLYTKEIDIIYKYETWNFKANRSTAQVLNVGSIWNM